MSINPESLLGESIIKQGESLNSEIAEEQAKLLKGFKLSEGFFVAIANALTWAERAVNDEEYFKTAVDFLASGEQKFLDKVREYPQWQGQEGLLQSLYGWRNIISKIKVPLVDGIAAKELLDFQAECRTKAIVLHRAGKIKGIEAWFLYAPFKTILAYRKDLWRNPAIDGIRMPAGIQVTKGLEELSKMKASWIKGYKEFGNFVSQENLIEGGLSKEGLFLSELTHAISARIACDRRIRCSSTLRRIIHANSGLYLLGKGMIAVK